MCGSHRILINDIQAITHRAIVVQAEKESKFSRLLFTPLTTSSRNIFTLPPFRGTSTIKFLLREFTALPQQTAPHRE